MTHRNAEKQTDFVSSRANLYNLVLRWYSICSIERRQSGSRDRPHSCSVAHVGNCDDRIRSIQPNLHKEIG